MVIGSEIIMKILDIFVMIMCFIMIVKSISEFRYGYTFLYGLIGFCLFYLSIGNEES